MMGKLGFNGLFQVPEAAIGEVFYEKLFLKISQYSQERTYVGVSL